MKIGHAVARSRLPAKTIRYYEDIELVIPDRSANGYRCYSEKDIHRLRFVQLARSLGFSVEECRLLLSLYKNNKKEGREIKALALEKVGEIDRKVSELGSLRSALTLLVAKCHGKDKPDFPRVEVFDERV